ncbi:hypothetical protein AB1E18_005248 [Capra hircus]
MWGRRGAGGRGRAVPGPGAPGRGRWGELSVLGGAPRAGEGARAPCGPPRRIGSLRGAAAAAAGGGGCGLRLRRRRRRRRGPGRTREDEEEAGGPAARRREEAQAAGAAAGGGGGRAGCGPARARRMKWSVRGACAALSSCLLLACALSAAAVGLKCFSLGSELRGEPFRLGAAAGAFYSGLLLAAGLSLLGAALLCCGPRDAPLAGPGPGPGLGVAAGSAGAAEAAPGDPGGAAGPSGPVSSQNLLLLGVLVFMLGVLSAFAGAVIDGDTVSLVERKYSHYCLPPRAPAAAPGPAPGPAAAGPGPAPGAPRARGTLDSATSAKCRQLKDYQRGLVLSTVFNSLECLLGLLSLLLVKNYKSSQARRGRRGRRKGGRALARPRGGPGLRAQPPASRARRGRRGRRGRRLQPRPSEASILSPEESDFAAPGDCAGFATHHAVSYINVGVFHAFDEAGVEVCCGGHPSVELPGYAPSDPDLNASYPYCCRPSCEAARPWEPGRAC